ncbi:hypothetical protein RB153_14725 [Paenibacillus larvae]|uniref:hypothetical protein n=1 Tax=Paenibacillus larvae TaxID=1464 RepID=UPI0003081C4B|nr:hypothetical protein [Paenibacillus larvae]MDR5596674.1 hypothetical protein [Paenibacillus larvae]
MRYGQIFLWSQTKLMIRLFVGVDMAWGLNMPIDINGAMGMYNRILHALGYQL